MNAAIEAEKAGGYGAGFSVVAGEMRRLADAAAVGAIEIEAAIGETVSSVRDRIMEVDLYARRSRASTANIVETGTDLRQMIGRVQDLLPHAEAVKQGMDMQSADAGRLSETMSQLDDIASLTGETLEEFRKATQRLSEAIRGLQGEVTLFTVNS